MYFVVHSVLCDPQRPLSTRRDEVSLAEEASKKYGSTAPTIFSKVIDKSIPADIIYEDEKVNITPCVQNMPGLSGIHLLIDHGSKYLLWGSH